MRNNKILLFSLAVLFSVLACEDPYNDNIDSSDTDYVSNDRQHPPTALDNWLHNTFTVPYNIEVKYEWDASEADVFRTLVPPSVAKVQTVMDVVNKVWIEPYVAVAGQPFIQTYCPKQFVLVGSASYNFDGTITLGTAEGGRKVVLYVVNDFDHDDQYEVKQMMHTVQHEFAHILHQSIAYPSDFREITPGDYTANWHMISPAEARSRGFITSYAMSSPDEDFVEMIAMMLVEGEEGYESILECEANQASKDILKRKEQLVVEYFREAYNIDFYELQKKVQIAINEIAPDDTGGENPPVLEVWGYDMEYTTLRFDLSVLSEPDDFIARYNYDNAVLHQAGLALDYSFKFYFSGPEELTLKLHYYEDGEDGRVYHEANFYFRLIHHEDGTIRFGYMGGDENGSYFEYDLQATALLAFFANYNFNVEWTNTCGGEAYVGLFPATSPDNYCFGILGN